MRMTPSRTIDVALGSPVAIDAASASQVTRRRAGLIEQAAVREVLMGAQDNLTNVLAVMLGVSVGSGRGDLVALAGLSAAVAEAISMGGVLYSSTRAEDNQLRATQGRVGDGQDRMSPMLSGVTTFAAALAGGLVPLAPFAVLPLQHAVVVSMTVSTAALFALGSWTGRASGAVWWRDGVRLVVVAGLAAVAAAAVGTTLAID
jgi:VIT1/CCC1 family predicted Fe2+/Mn2+ transporter